MIDGNKYISAFLFYLFKKGRVSIVFVLCVVYSVSVSKNVSVCVYVCVC